MRSGGAGLGKTRTPISRWQARRTWGAGAPVFGAVPARVARRQLGGDEHVVAVQAAVGEGAADLILVAVYGRGVDVPVAGLQGVPGGLVGELALDLPGAEADHRHCDAAAQVHLRDLG